jgi:hypothetical protein
MRMINHQRMVYFPEDDPFFTECCGCAIFGDIKDGVMCPACGDELFLPPDECEENDAETGE